jgi:hypothetical protein
MERFWSKVRIGDINECWLWEAAMNPQGYGQFGLERDRAKGINKRVAAHRFAWELTYGPIPEGLSVLHRCDTPLCVNPKHLFLGTQADNMRDMAAKGRHRGMSGLQHRYDRRGITITREIANQIRLAAGAQKEIASEFGVDPSTVSRIKGGKAWREDAPRRKSKQYEEGYRDGYQAGISRRVACSGCFGSLSASG